jgi:hypothetical protein
MASCALPGDFDRFRGEGQFRDEQEFQDVLARWFCAKIVDCETKLGLVGVGFQLICHPGILEDVGVGQMLRSHPLGSGPGATFDLEAARACRDALFDLARCEMPGQVLPEPCRQVYTGTLAAGERCVADSECTRGRCDFVHGRCPEGLCVDRVEEGGACADNEACEVNLVCRGGECLPVGEQGDVCDPGDGPVDCGELLWCDGGVCQPLPNVGDDCATGFALDPCRGSLVCTQAFGGRCVVGGEEGDSCDQAGDPPCAPGFRCDQDGQRCVSLLLPGQQGCASALNCPFLHDCQDGACVPLPMPGEACSPILPCLEGACVDGVCTPLADGEACSGEVPLGECEGYCAPAEDAGAPRLCAPHGDEGADCDPFSIEAQCAEGLACTGGDGTGPRCTACEALF